MSLHNPTLVLLRNSALANGVSVSLWEQVERYARRLDAPSELSPSPSLEAVRYALQRRKTVYYANRAKQRGGLYPIYNDVLTLLCTAYDMVTACIRNGLSMDDVNKVHRRLNDPRPYTEDWQSWIPMPDIVRIEAALADYYRDRPGKRMRPFETTNEMSDYRKAKGEWIARIHRLRLDWADVEVVRQLPRGRKTHVKKQWQSTTRKGATMLAMARALEIVIHNHKARPWDDQYLAAAALYGKTPTYMTNRTHGKMPTKISELLPAEYLANVREVGAMPDPNDPRISDKGLDAFLAPSFAYDCRTLAASCADAGTPLPTPLVNNGYGPGSAG